MADDQQQQPYDYTQDKDFLAAPPEQQHAYLQANDPDYAKADPKTQGAYVAHLRGYDQPTNFEKERDPQKQPGVLSTVGGYIKNAVTPQPPSKSDFAMSSMLGPLPGLVKNAYQGYTGARSRGHGVPYSMAAGAGADLGVNAPAMEQAADVGNRRAILGEAAVPAAMAVAPVAAEGVARGLNEVIPQTGRAGRNFQAVSKAAGGDQVAVTPKLSDSIMRVKELSDRGHTMPKVANRFFARVTDPAAPPVTYDEARDFYSKAGEITSSEAQRMSPTMRRALNNFRSALGDSVSDTASKAGQGETYKKAMSEYSAAKGLHDKAGKLGKLGLGMAGLYGAYKTGKELLGSR